MIVIPARWNSTRFPGKPLAKINGKEMLLRVYENIKELGTVVVTTDHNRIMDFCIENGIDCFLTTDKAIHTGTDRVRKYIEYLNGAVNPLDPIINVQGDSPLLTAEMIKELYSNYTSTINPTVWTLVRKISWSEVLHNDRGTYVVKTESGKALYFSKNKIPSTIFGSTLKKCPMYKHIGVYLYNKETLLSLPKKVTELERLEGLEQLRWMENNINIQCIEVEPQHEIIGVDYPEDVEIVETILERRKIKWKN